MYFIEIHKAKYMYKIIRNCLQLIDKLGVNQILKTELKTELNRILQFLNLKSLREINEEQLKEINNGAQMAGRRTDVYASKE